MQFIEAVLDFRYLLTRGYNREGALRFVGDHYQLNRYNRLLLYRCVYGEREAEEHRRKILSTEDVRGRTVAIDGYNLLITVESGLQGKQLILSDDGFIRDLSAVHNRYTISSTTEEALRLIGNSLRNMAVSEARFYFDSQISKSGRLAAMVRLTLQDVGVKGNARAVKQADNSVVKDLGIAVSSDSVVIERARAVYDLGGHIVMKIMTDKITRLGEL